MTELSGSKNTSPDTAPKPPIEKQLLSAALLTKAGKYRDKIVKIIDPVIQCVGLSKHDKEAQLPPQRRLIDRKIKQLEGQDRKYICKPVQVKDTATKHVNSTKLQKKTAKSWMPTIQLYFTICQKER